MTKTTSLPLLRRTALLLLAVLTQTTWAQQIITGYTADSGTAGTKEAEVFDKLVDGDRTTKWCVTNVTNKTLTIEFQSVKNLVSEMGATATLYAQWQGGDLADGSDYKITEDFDLTTATFTKSLEGRMGKHQAWLVPFDYTITKAELPLQDGTPSTVASLMNCPHSVACTLTMAARS